MLFGHIAGAAVWAGGGIVLTILALRLQRARDYTAYVMFDLRSRSVRPIDETA
ncbi:MAG: hypothetical protein M3188_07135 [Actinomycetota bacterium]|nr:hypothetical protein [Actinomycetota bacterium]